MKKRFQVASLIAPTPPAVASPPVTRAYWRIFVRAWSRMSGVISRFSFRIRASAGRGSPCRYRFQPTALASTKACTALGLAVISLSGASTMAA